MGTTESDLRRWMYIVISVVALALAGAAAITYILVGQLRAANQQVIYEKAEELRNAEAFALAVYTRSSSARGYLLSGEPAFLDDRAAARRQLRERIPRLQRDGHVEVLSALEALFERLDVASTRAIDAYAAAPETAHALWEDDAMPIQNEIEQLTEQMLVTARSRFESAREVSAARSVRSIRLLVVLLVAIGVVIAVLLYAYGRATRSLLARQKAEQEQVTFRLLEQVPVGIFVVTPQGVPYYANQHAQKILGRGVERLGDASLSSAYRTYESGADRLYPAERLPVMRALRGEVCEVTNIEIRRDDEVIPLHVVAAPVTNARGELMYAVSGFQDVRELQRIAMRDALTGLANRAALSQAYAREQLAAKRRDQPLAIGLIDLDRFKSINDTHGHSTGDEVLRRTAETLQRVLRRTDLLGRWGGEELAVLLPDTNIDGARITLDKMLAAVRELRLAGKDGQPFGVTFSAGAVVAGDDETLEGAIARADKLLYAAKAAGRDRVLVAEPTAV